MENHPLPNHYKNVGLLITHYNRSQSLERLLKSFIKLGVSFGEIVVSDDGSPTGCLNELHKQQQIFGFKLITTKQNKGLGNNLNKGQRNITKPFTLYVQEDFVPLKDFVYNFTKALNIMETKMDIDIIRFYAYFKHPYTKSFDDTFNEMVFNPSILKPNHLKFYVYSDHPHLRRSTFLEKFKPYAEGIDVDITEFQMCLSFLKNKGKGLQMKNFNLMFDQINSNTEPSTAQRAEWINGKSVLAKTLRSIYIKFKTLKSTFQYLNYR